MREKRWKSARKCNDYDFNEPKPKKSKHNVNIGTPVPETVVVELNDEGVAYHRKRSKKKKTNPDYVHRIVLETIDDSPIPKTDIKKKKQKNEFIIEESIADSKEIENKNEEIKTKSKKKKKSKLENGHKKHVDEVSDCTVLSDITKKRKKISEVAEIDFEGSALEDFNAPEASEAMDVSTEENLARKKLKTGSISSNHELALENDEKETFVSQNDQNNGINGIKIFEIENVCMDMEEVVNKPSKENESTNNLSINSNNSSKGRKLSMFTVGDFLDYARKIDTKFSTMPSFNTPIKFTAQPASTEIRPPKSEFVTKRRRRTRTKKKPVEILDSVKSSPVPVFMPPSASPSPSLHIRFDEKENLSEANELPQEKILEIEIDQPEINDKVDRNSMQSVDTLYCLLKKLYLKKNIDSVKHTLLNNDMFPKVGDTIAFKVIYSPV